MREQSFSSYAAFEGAAGAMKGRGILQKIEYVWKDRKHILGLPLSFTKYMLTEDRLFVEKGLLNTTYDEENLYRVRDVRVTRNLGQKIVGVGTVTVFSTDKSNGETVLKSIRNPIEVKEQIVRLVEVARKKNNIRASEMLMDAPETHVCDHDGDGLQDE